MSFNSSAKKIGAVFCAAAMLMVVAQSVISNENQKPIAIAGNDVFVDIGVTVGFDGSLSYDPDDMININSSEEPRPLNFTWNFQDGMCYGAQSYHAFETAGVYLVILMVRDHVGAAGFDALTVNVRNTPPVAIAEVNKTAYEDEILIFNGTKSTDNYTDMPSLEYYWDFGDGISANSSVVNHTYTRSGTYISTLKVVDGDGAMDIEFTEVNVSNLPPVTGKFMNQTVQEDTPITFNGVAFDTITDQELLKYHWDFGDGSAFAGRSVEHTYTKSGLYEVNFTVIDDNGLYSSELSYVTVENLEPTVTIKNVLGTIYEGETYIFGALGEDTVTDVPLLDYDWGFGKNGWSASNVWDDDWTGEVTCQATDDDEATGQAVNSINVENVNPIISVTDAYLVANITLQMAGERWHDLTLYLNESAVNREQLYVFRESGNPYGQANTTENVKISMSEAWTTQVVYSPDDDPVNGQPAGGDTCRITIEFDNGAVRWFERPFLVSHPEDWVWTLNLKEFMFLPNSQPYGWTRGGNPTMHFEYEVFDQGRDSETITWDFGESLLIQTFGASSFPTEITSTLQYTPIDLQNITVTVRDDDGGFSQTVLNFNDKTLDNVAPRAQASGTTNVNEDSTASFSGSGSDTVSDAGNLNYIWNFGDGEIGSGQTVTHIYTNEGTYMVILEVSDGTDSSYDAFFIEVDNVAPRAIVSDVINDLLEDDLSKLNGTFSTDTISDVDSLLYSWVYGTLAKSVGNITEHIFSFMGSYDVTLTVTDDNGAFDTVTETINVDNVPPYVEAENNLTVFEDQTAFLSCNGIDTISDEPILGYNWSFEREELVAVPIVNETTNLTDPYNVTYELANVIHYYPGWNPTFIYPDSGEYKPPVTVTDDNGEQCTTTANVAVVNVPPIAFIGNNMKIFAGITNISFNATGIDTFSDIDSLDYYWDFGNGDASYRQNVVYAYRVDGNYTVNLTVTDNDGAVATHSINVTVRIDSDGDGMPDVWEIMHGLDHLDPTGDNGAEGDPDEDFLVNIQEYYYGLHPWDDDCDDDGLLDGIEDFNRNGIVDDDETNPLNRDTDGDNLHDGMELGLAMPQGENTTSWQQDMDPVNTTNPLDADTDDDGIIDGNEDLNHNGIRDGTETAPQLADTDDDDLLDGMEIGLTEPEHIDTNVNIFKPDYDPTTTTDPNDPDSDNDGLLDGIEDIDHDGLKDANEPNPNDWDSEDDGLADGSGNTVTILTLTHIKNKDLVNDHLTYLWVNGSDLPHKGYQVPANSNWIIPANSSHNLNQIVSVTFFLSNMPITIYDGSGVNYNWIPDTTNIFNVSTNNLTLYFESVITDYSFADPNPAITDADGDEMDDFAEALYFSGRMQDFRSENTDGDDCNRILLDGTTIFNNLIDPDSDNDGLLDGEEWLFGSDMLNADTEGDGIGDYEEYIEGTNPIDSDTDWDGLTDYEELRLASDGLLTAPTNPDMDGDTLFDGWNDVDHNMIYNAGETWGEYGDQTQHIPTENRNAGGYGTSAMLNDTDGDELLDGEEVAFWNLVWQYTTVTHLNLIDGGWNTHNDADGIINLLDPDSDNDGINDGPEKDKWESYTGTPAPGWKDNNDGDRKVNIIDPDSDNELLLDGEEMLIYGTRADKWDTDEDGIWSYYIDGWYNKNVFNDYTEVNYWLGVGKSTSEIGANACDNDTDNDGMWDGWEKYHNLNPDISTGDNGPDGDPDHDGLINIQEYIPDNIHIRYNLFPSNYDTDSDGLRDGFNDVNGDGIWNDLNANGLWDTGEEAWGEIGDPDNSFAGGYRTSAIKRDTDGDHFTNNYAPPPNSAFTSDSAEINYWLARSHRTEPRNYNSAEAGSMARTLDVDRDGISDGFEVLFSTMTTSTLKQENTIMTQTIILDPDNPNDAGNDPDQDGLSSWEEYVGWTVRVDYGTGIEYDVWSLPNSNNWDLDALDDSSERDYSAPDYGTDPWNSDSDGDGLKDGASNEPNALDPDSDDDGLGDLREYNMVPGAVFCSYTDPDSDNDGLWDGWHDADKDAQYDNSETKGELGEGTFHIGGFSTRPVYPDTDGDGFYDGWVDSNANSVFNAGEDWGEIGDPANVFTGGFGSNANDADTDNDGLTDKYEQITLDSRLNLAPLNFDGTGGDNLHDSDSDDDGLCDGWDDTSGDQLYDSWESWGEVGNPTQSYIGGYRSYSRDRDSDDDNFEDGEEAQYWNGISSIAWYTQYDSETEISNLRDSNADVDSWLDGDEVKIYYTLPNDEDCDNDGVNDNIDIDPLIDLKLYVKVTEILALDDVDSGSQADFYIKWSIDASYQTWYLGVGITDSDDTPSSWDNDDYRTPTEIGNWFYYEVNIHDHLDWAGWETIDIGIELFDDDDSDRDDRCDISGRATAGNGGTDPWAAEGESGRISQLTYDRRTGGWTGDDFLGDSNGYGHVSGSEDGSIGGNEANDHEDDCEVWFIIWQNEYDTDGLTYWQEVGPNNPQTYRTDPTKRDTDEDGLWDREMLYTDFQADENHKNNPSGDKDGDFLTNAQEINIISSNPIEIDSDGDTMNDGWEWKWNSKFSPIRWNNPDSDTDGDGFNDEFESRYDKNPIAVDIKFFDLTIGLFSMNKDALYIADVCRGIRLAAAYLFDVTDGYMIFRHIKIIDQWTTEDEAADILIYSGDADDPSDGNWPHAMYNRLTGRWEVIVLPETYYSDNPDSPRYSRAITHEFGHYGLDLWDEYIDSSGNSLSNAPVSLMNSNSRRLSTLRDYDVDSSTLPNYIDARSTYQWSHHGQSCWETIFDNYHSLISFDLNKDGLRDTSFPINYDASGSGISGPFIDDWDLQRIMNFTLINR